MGNIDLITVVHSEDKRDPKFKYTFKAPANSGIMPDDYVIADIKGKETLGKVVSVLEDIDENSSTMAYIRSVSTIKDQELKPLSYKLVKVALVDDTDDNINEEKDARLNSNIFIGATYYSIEQGVVMRGIVRNYYLYLEEYTYCDCEADRMRIESNNMFFSKLEAEKIIDIINDNANTSKYIDIKKELKKIL